MAEAYLKKFGGEKFHVESAGLEAGTLNQYAVAAMKEDGIDISGNSTSDVFEFYKEGRVYDYVVTVCDKEASDRCPVFPGMHKKINWSFNDPSGFKGTDEEKLKLTVAVRNQIKNAVLDLVNDLQ